MNLDRAPAATHISLREASGVKPCAMHLCFRLLLFIFAFALLSACSEGTESGVAAPQGRPLVVRRGNGGEPGSLDPAIAEDVHTFNILTDLSEGLVSVSADGQIIPGVAESWEISDDGLLYTFKLRENAKWSNGEGIVAEDFVRSFRRLAEPETGSAYSFLIESVRHFSSIQSGDALAEQLAVTATGSHTLQIELEQRVPYFISILAIPVAMPVYGTDSDSVVGLSPADFVGNGAFVLSAHTPGGELTVTKNLNYWDASSVEIDEVVFVPIIDPTAEFHMYRAGQLDITNTIPPANVEMVSRDLPDHVQIAPSLALYYLAFDVSEAPLNSRDLRMALSMAIDRKTIVSVVGRGELPAYGVVPPGVMGYENSNKLAGEMSDDEREAQARELYERAGYSGDKPLRLELTYDSGDIHERIALAVSSMWRDVLGIDCTLRKMEWQYFLDTRDNREEWQIMRFAWTGDYNDASTFTNIFRSNDLQNLSGYSNPEYDHLLGIAESESDSNKRADVIGMAEQILINDQPIAPLYFYVSKHLVRPNITGYQQNVLDRHPSKYIQIDNDE